MRIEGRLVADEMRRVWNVQVDIREKGMGDGRGRGSQEEIGFGLGEKPRRPPHERGISQAARPNVVSGVSNPRFIVSSTFQTRRVSCKD